MKTQELKEGGNVLFYKDGQEISGGPIARGDIRETLWNVASVTKLPMDYLEVNVMGSVGKADISGDLDIAVDYEVESLDSFKDRMSEHQIKVYEGFRMINMLFPIIGNDSKNIPEYNGFVQVDFFFGDVNWLKFSHFSAGDASAYPGKYRTALLMAVTSAITYFTDYSTTGELLAKVGMVFDPARGIISQYRILPKKKTGDGYVQKMIKTIPSNPEWQERYGSIQIQAPEFEIYDPTEAAEFLFGKGTKPEDLNSYEQVLELVNTTKTKEEQLLIDKIFRLRME